MPHVRVLAGPPRLVQGPLGPQLEADTTADLLLLLEASPAVSDHASRAALLALVERFEPACDGLLDRIARVRAAPDLRARLGMAGPGRFLQAARVGPTVEVSLAQAALLSSLRRWCLRHMGEADLARFGELVDGLVDLEPGPADALDIEAALAPPAAEPKPVDPPPPPPPADPTAPTDPAPPPDAPAQLPNVEAAWAGILPAPANAQAQSAYRADDWQTWPRLATGPVVNVLL